MVRNYALVFPYFSLSVACRQLCPTFSGNLVCIGLLHGHMHTIFCIFMKEMARYHADLRQLFVIGTHFGVDLMHRKAEVKDIITDVINNMSDEEEEADDDGGDDTDKDEDKDEDA